jgi:hypothetical protein
VSAQQVPAGRRVAKAWWILSALFAVSSAGMAAKNLDANWGLPHKDAYFHAAGLVELGGVLVSAAVAVLMFRASRRAELGSALYLTATALTTLAVLAVAAGGLLGVHATSLCSCDGG